MNTFNEVLKELMDKFDMSDSHLAELVGVNRSTVVRWRNGIRSPKLEKIPEIASVFEVDPKVFIGKKTNNLGILTIYNQLEQPRQQKVYNFAERELEEQRYIEEHDYVGQTAAGAPIEGQQPVPLIGATTVKLLVNGDSMKELFHDGDIIEYHPQPELENGEIGVFAINGGVTMKKFRRNSDIRLESLNKKYQDIVIQETDDFSILGKVII